MNRLQSRREIKRRVALPPEEGEERRRCLVWGCGRPTQRASARGLSHGFCKSHVEFHRRHGSYSRRSYTKAELAPYRKAADKWLRDNNSGPMVLPTIATLQALLDGSGRTVSAYSLRGVDPEDRVRAVLANLRYAGKKGRQLLLITLAVKAATADLGPRGNPEFRHVQISKALHRLASGTHRTTSGFPIKSKYPRAEGNFMRLLGRKVEDVAGIVATPEAVAEVVDLAETFKREVPSSPTSGFGPAR